MQTLRFGPPAVAFIGTSIAVWIAATVEGVSVFTSSSWIRWDSPFYLQIASSGYQLFPCTGPPYPPNSWCGNAGWFPGYSGLLAPLFDLGLPQGATAVVVSWAFGFGLLVLLWNGFLRRLPGAPKYFALAFAAFGPGGIYTRAVFPMSMTVFFVLLWALLLQRDRVWWAGAAGAVAAACYPTAVLLAPVGAIWLLLADGNRPMSQRAVRGLGHAALVAVGSLAALWVMWLQTGTWSAYFKTQAKYDHGFHEPFANLWPLVHSVLNGARGITALPAIEATVVAVMVVALLGGYAVRLAKRRAVRSEHLTALLVVVFWLAPLTQANVSYNRSDVLLAPAALLVARAGIPAGALLLSTTASLYCFLAYGFFQGVLT